MQCQYATTAVTTSARLLCQRQTNAWRQPHSVPISWPPTYEDSPLAVSDMSIGLPLRAIVVAIPSSQLPYHGHEDTPWPNHHRSGPSSLLSWASEILRGSKTAAVTLSNHCMKHPPSVRTRPSPFLLCKLPGFRLQHCSFLPIKLFVGIAPPLCP